MGKKGETREKGPTPREWNKFVRQFVRQVEERIKACRKAAAYKRKIEQIAREIRKPRNQNPGAPKRSLVKPTGKSSVGRKRIKMAVKNSRN